MVSHTDGVYTLDGHDDQCGAGRAPAAGVATINADGSIAIGLTILPRRGTIGVALPVNVHAQLAPGDTSGTWNDNGGEAGPFALNGSTAGNPRPSPDLAGHYGAGFHARGRFGRGYFFGLSHNGTTANPTATESGDTLARWGGGGHTGTSFDWPSGQIQMKATENWTPGPRNADRVPDDPEW